jgi:hypothetical protein
MLPDLTAMEWVSVTSLSLSLSALVARFLTKDEKISARAHLLSAVVVLALLSAALGSIYSFKRAAEIAALADEIYFVLGNQQKTTDQILVELGPQKEANFTAAIAALRSKHAIESEVEQIQIHSSRPNAVRVWRALANK